MNQQYQDAFDELFDSGAEPLQQNVLTETQLNGVAREDFATVGNESVIKGDY